MIVLLVNWETAWIFQIWLLRSCTKEHKGTWRNFSVWLGGFGTIETMCFMRQMEPWKLTFGGIKEANGLDFKHKMDKKDHWEPPPVGFYIINVNGAIPLANGHLGIETIV